RALNRQNALDDDLAIHFEATAADPLLQRRLQVLRTMGLAEPVGRARWRLRKDFESVLHSMKKIADRQKMLASCAAAISDPRLPMQLTPVSQIHRLDGRVLGHALDDSSGRAHLIL